MASSKSSKSKSRLGSSASVVGISSRAQEWLVYTIMAIILFMLAYYVVPYLFMVNDSVDSVKAMESFNDEQTIKAVKDAIKNLSEENQQGVCAIANSLVSGYRSLFSGAVFKFTESSKDSGDYFLFGPDMRVVEVSDDGTNSLFMSIKNKNPQQQLFKRELATKDNTGANIASGSEICYVFTPKKSKDMALQYEHEYLSVRPIIRDAETDEPRPFIGQCFLRFQATEEELNASALATGLGIPSLNSRNLVSKSGFTGNAQDSLANITRQIEEQARSPAIRDYAEYQNKTGGPQTEVGEQGNPFANKPIQVNLDLASILGRDGFQDNDARNPDSGSTSVRALLDNYTSMLNGNTGVSSQVSSKELAVNKAYRESLDNSASNGAGVPVGCPGIDRSMYYTERQLSQCAGCTPDDSMRNASSN